MKDYLISFSKTEIKKIITKPDVYIIYLNTDEYWLCDKNFPPEDNGNMVTYKLAQKNKK